MTGQYVREEYPLSEVTSRIIKAAKEVHKELGSGFEEVVYQRALALEFPIHGLDFSREVWIEVHYKGQKVGRKRVDVQDELETTSGSVIASEAKQSPRYNCRQRWRLLRRSAPRNDTSERLPGGLHR